MTNIRFSDGCDETFVEERSLHIDCDYCEHQGSETCQDCMVTYLCRPDRTSELVVQGKTLNQKVIQATINDCLLSDDVLAMQQQQLQQQQPTSQG